ncbi:TNT domain-containing protein [Amycolatopsis nigrescens]|uniref:TNT domain-containing protein n=1 Tax=Amycolatopsis nigrescens TaxID=381445 RepID=UPI000374372B|nr:TNT domain-containing protein [Amycolatopsis nigrescens]
MSQSQLELSAAEQGVLLSRIGKLAREYAPEGGRRIEIDFQQLGELVELEARTVDDSTERLFATPPELLDLLTELRTGMYRPGRGAWLRARYTLNLESIEHAGATFDFDFALDDEPRWHHPPDDASTAFADELATFPRAAEHIPDWWRLRIGLPLNLNFRRAQVVRTETAPLPEAEVPHVLHYLETEPVVSGEDESGPDVFASDADPVPAGLHTDGIWIWPAAVPYYLRKYAIAPEPELVEHIRARNFQPPYVPPLVRRTAAADLRGEPRPEPGLADYARTTADLAARWETQPNPRLRELEVLMVLAKRLGEQGVWPSAYRIGGRADGAWCLNSTANGWEVAYYTGETPVSPQLFDRVTDAAQQLLGALLMHPARITAGQETPLETATELADWPIGPSDGEPPLTLLRNKRMLALTAGSTVLRFGDDTGNLVHLAGARFPSTSLPLERERTRRQYRLHRRLYVLSGITVPWANMPGGAVAYVLPKTVGEHVADGSLIELPES